MRSKLTRICLDLQVPGDIGITPFYTRYYYYVNFLVSLSVSFTGGGLLRVYSCSDVVANRCRF